MAIKKLFKICNTKCVEMVIVRLQEKGLLYSDITEVFISKKLLVQILSVVVETLCDTNSSTLSPHFTTQEMEK